MTPASVQHQVCGGLTGSTSWSTRSSQETAEIAKTRASLATNTNNSFTFERVSVALVAPAKNQSKLTTRACKHACKSGLGSDPHVRTFSAAKAKWNVFLHFPSASTCDFILRHAHRCVPEVWKKYVLQIFDAAYLCHERPLSRSQATHFMQMKTLLSVRAKSVAHLLHPGPSYPAVPGSKFGPTSLRNEHNILSRIISIVSWRLG